MALKKLAIGLMHAPWAPGRPKLLSRVLDSLNDTSEIDFKIIEDTNHDGIWGTARRCWDFTTSCDAEYAMVMQDDMMPCKNFLQAAQRIIEICGSRVVSFYSPSNAGTHAAESRGQSWHSSLDAGWGGSVMIPMSVAMEFLKWVDEYLLPDFLPDQDDTRLNLFLMLHNLKIFHTSPSLIEHIGKDASVVGHAGPGRQASRFIGDGDPNQIDWTAGLQNPSFIGIHWPGSLAHLRCCMNSAGQEKFRDLIRNRFML